MMNHAECELTKERVGQVWAVPSPPHWWLGLKRGVPLPKLNFQVKTHGFMSDGLIDVT